MRQRWGCSCVAGGIIQRSDYRNERKLPYVGLRTVIHACYSASPLLQPRPPCLYAPGGKANRGGWNCDRYRPRATEETGTNSTVAGCEQNDCQPPSGRVNEPWMLPGAGHHKWAETQLCPTGAWVCEGDRPVIEAMDLFSTADGTGIQRAAVVRYASTAPIN